MESLLLARAPCMKDIRIIIKNSFEYRIYPKCLDTLSSYHTCPKIWKTLFYCLLMNLNYCCMYGKQCRSWSSAVCKGLSVQILRVIKVIIFKLCLKRICAAPRLGNVWYNVDLCIRTIRSGLLLLQSNLNGSNIFGTMEICSRYG